MARTHDQGHSLTDHFIQQTGFSEEFLKPIAMHLVQQSRAVAAESDHHRYHVGSSLLSISNGKQHVTEILETNANKIPQILKDKGITAHDRIGDGHPTVHGEFPLLNNAPPSKHLFLGCNTPLCANCLKSAIMRGVDAIFLDADSLPGRKGPDAKENPWTQDRSDLWNDFCVPVARAAKIPIYAVDLQTGTLSILVSGVPPKERPSPQKPARILDNNEIHDLQNNPDLYLSAARGARAAIGVAKNKSTGEQFYIFAEDCYPPGFDEQEGARMTEKYKNAHYRFPLDPIIHMAMEASKHNLELEDGKIFTNFVPSADRQLDLAYIGISHILFSSEHLPLTEGAKMAMRTLKDLDVIAYHAIKPNKAIARLLGNDNDLNDSVKPD